MRTGMPPPTPSALRLAINLSVGLATETVEAEALTLGHLGHRQNALRLQPQVASPV
jgi:hypothetical protein